MSVRLRISVFRLDQLSTHRLYDGLEHLCNLDPVRRGQKRLEAAPRVGELSPRPLGLAVLRLPARRRQMAEPCDERPLAEPCCFCERASRLPVLGSRQMPLGAPQDRLQSCCCGRPLVFHAGR